jgi:hypothetical protein
MKGKAKGKRQKAKGKSDAGASNMLANNFFCRLAAPCVDACTTNRSTFALCLLPFAF